MDDYQQIRQRHQNEEEIEKPLLGEYENDNKYVKPQKENKEGKLLLKEKPDLVIACVFLLLGLCTRYFQIGKSNVVVWDEAHFGGFASQYLKREFYFDVHPPLGKMLIALAGYLAGYDGQWGWDSGATFPETLNFRRMRIFCATFGALIVPLAYLTACELKFQKKVCLLIGLMVLCENGLIVISKFVLLDPILIFFTSLSFFCLTKFHNQREKPFSMSWFVWLFLTGVSIGCVSSIKWVGLFAVALVGLYTIWELWDYLGDMNMSNKTYIGHWLARILCLIIVPISVYALNFSIHFKILFKSGKGDAQMSSLFQAGLEGIDLAENPLNIAYNSKVTIKNSGYGGGLLHSHVQRYPAGSEQQQVTCYHHKDSNNDWFIKKPWNKDQVPDDKIEYLKDGDIIRLVHVQTTRNLHSHNVKAPITSQMNEVSCYGNLTLGDSNDHWKVEIVDDMKVRKPDNVRALLTRFRLRHVNSGCLLRSHNVNLPQWGFKQAEVACDKDKKADNQANNMWNIERHWNDLMEPAPKAAYKSKFINDFIDLNVAMWTSNNALVPDPDKEPDQLVSQAWQWPLALVGIRMCSWSDTSVKYYMMGNPFIWWFAFASLLCLGAFSLFYVLRRQRKITYVWAKNEWFDYCYRGLITFGGWALHYLPFYIMGRVLYLHHYFPTIYFGIFVIGFMVDHISFYFKKFPMIHNIIVCVVGTIIVISFLFFSKLTYGFTGPSSQVQNRQWLSSWHMATNSD